MDAISTTMPHVDNEPEDIESKEGIIDTNIPLVKLTMPSKYFKCGEIFVEDTLKLTLVCALCEKQFTEMKLFGAHITCVHLSSEKFEPLLLETVKEEFSIEEDSFQDGNSNYEPFNASYYNVPDEMNGELIQIKESASDDNDSAQSSTEKVISKCSSHKNNKKYLKLGKWTDFCGKCGLKFKNNQDYEIHHKLKHTYLSNGEKTRLEKLEASIVYVAHTCPMCYSDHKRKNKFVEHLRSKHSLDPESMKSVLEEEFRSTRDDTKPYQLLLQVESVLEKEFRSTRGDTKSNQSLIKIKPVLEKEFRSTGDDTTSNQSLIQVESGIESSSRHVRDKLCMFLWTKRKSEQTQKNDQNQQSEAIDPESFAVNEDLPAIRSNETLIEPLTAINNMETTDSMPSVIEEEFETEMDFGSDECGNATQDISKQKSPDLCTKADDTNYDIVIEKHSIPIQTTSKQTAPITLSEMQSYDSTSTNIKVPFCGKCGYKFTYKLGHQLHYKILHSNFPPEVKEELKKKTSKYSYLLVPVPIACTMCGVIFKSTISLKYHLKAKHNLMPGTIHALLLQEKQGTHADSRQMSTTEQLLKPSVVTNIEAAFRESQNKAEVIANRKAKTNEAESPQGICTKSKRQCIRKNKLESIPKGNLNTFKIKHGILTKL